MHVNQVGLARHDDAQPVPAAPVGDVQPPERVVEVGVDVVGMKRQCVLGGLTPPRRLGCPAGQPFVMPVVAVRCRCQRIFAAETSRDDPGAECQQSQPAKPALGSTHRFPLNAAPQPCTQNSIYANTRHRAGWLREYLAYPPGSCA